MHKFKKYLDDYWIDLSFVFFIVAIYSGFNFIWLSYEKIPPHWDMGRHLWTSLLYLNMFHWDHFWHLWTDYYYYPPFRYWLSIPFYLVFGNSFTVAVMSNIVFIFILAFSVYEIGRMLWGRSTGLLAMFGILCSPMFIGQFKEYQLDAQLSAMVALSFCFLIKTKEFSDKKYSMLFGLSFGLGMLTKWTFICCLFFPLIYSAVKCISANKSNRKKNVENLIWAVFIGISVSLLWYGNHPRMIWNDFIGVRRDFKEAPMSPGELCSWYLRYFELVQMYLFPTFLFFIGFIASLFNKSWFERNLYPYLLVAGSYLIFTVLKHDCRYTMPMLVGCFIFVVYWFELVKSKLLRIILKTVFVLYCCFTFAVISGGDRLFPYHIEQVKMGSLVLFQQDGYGVSGPDSTDWHQEEIFKIISEDKSENKVVGWQMPDHDDIRFNGWGNNYFALKYNIALKIPKENPVYLLIRSFRKIDVDGYAGYTPYRQYVLPDQSFVCLFKKKGV